MKTVDPTLHDLDRGLRLVHIHDRNTRAGIFGVTVRAGSADEKPEEFGLAHFVEHTIFKGTLRRSSWHIINRMESVGGELNAYTTKDNTVVYTIFPAGSMSRAVELVADLVINSQFPDKELEKEREVVIDEINSYLDSPAEAIFDDFEDLAFAGTGYGHNILGTPQSVESLTSASCRRFLASRYTGPNMVAFYTGPASAERVAAAVNRYFASISESPASDEQVPLDKGCVRFVEERHHPIHQSHVVLGARLPAVSVADRYAISLLSNIIGGPGMNSLLNVELRERRGLVYTVEASTAFFGGCGLTSVYFGCDEDDRARCMSLCGKVLESVADGSALVGRRFEQARKQYLGQLTIAVENKENRALAAARSTLFYGRPLTHTEVRSHILALKPEDLMRRAEALTEPSVLAFIP